MLRLQIQKPITASALAWLMSAGTFSTALAGPLPDCFDKLPKDRTWKSELILKRSADSQDAQFEGIISDGTSDEGDALRLAAEQFANCVVKAVSNRSDMGFRMSFIIHSEREGDLVAPSPDHARTQKRVPPTSSPSVPPVPLGESPSSARCLRGLAPGQSWRMVWVISRVKAVATSDLPWTLTIDLVAKPSNPVVNDLTQFARCISTAWSLPGKTTGPNLRDNGKQLQYTSTP